MARLAVVLALAAAALASPPAPASFPGRNGDIALLHTHGARYQVPQHELRRYHPRTGAMRRVSLCGVASHTDQRYCETAWAPAAAPGGGRMAFLTSGVRPPAGASLRILDLATLEQRLVPLPAGLHGLNQYHELSWLPGADRLVATRRLDPFEPLDPMEPMPPTGIFTLGLDGSEQAMLAADASAPDAAIDGRVAFVRRGNVHVVHPGGAGRRLTRRGGADPSFSPRGRWIAFSRGAYLFAAPSGGGPPVRLARGGHAAWSPDGRRIAFLHESAYGEVTLRVLDWATRRVLRVPRTHVGSNDALSDSLVQGPEWLPRPR
jgi:hypothetical protein